MKLTPSSLGQKRTQTSSVPTPTKTTKGTEMLYSMTQQDFDKLKKVMRDLYDSDQSEHGDIIFALMQRLGRISTGKL